jgi:UDP-glucose 4-epimerase
MKRVLIIGGKGFVGSALAKRLVSNGLQVVILDNLITGIDRQIDGIENFHKENATDINNVIENTLDNNIKPILEILKFCRKKNSKLIYSGSSTKFGDNGLARNTNPYAFSKSINSEIVKYYCQEFDLPFAITYFYNVYGDGENADGEYATVIAKFLDRKKKNLPLEVRLPGTQVRNFTNINCTVNALELIGRRGYGDYYGIGHDKSWSIIEIAKMISQDIIYSEPVKANRMHAELMTRKTKELGWSARVNLDEYIQEVLGGKV